MQHVAQGRTPGDAPGGRVSSAAAPLVPVTERSCVNPPVAVGQGSAWQEQLVVTPGVRGRQPQPQPRGRQGSLGKRHEQRPRRRGGRDGSSREESVSAGPRGGGGGRGGSCAHHPPRRRLVPAGRAGRQARAHTALFQRRRLRRRPLAPAAAETTKTATSSFSSFFSSSPPRRPRHYWGRSSNPATPGVWAGGGAAAATAAASAATAGATRNGKRPAVLGMRHSSRMLSPSGPRSRPTPPLRRHCLRLRALGVGPGRRAGSGKNPLLRVLLAAWGRVRKVLGRLSAPACRLQVPGFHPGGRTGIWRDPVPAAGGWSFCIPFPFPQSVRCQREDLLWMVLVEVRIQGKGGQPN